MSVRTKEQNIFKALASPLRRDMLDVLRGGPETTKGLCSHFPDIDRCTVMQHLDVLERADLIIVRRAGRERWNLLNPIPIKHIHDRWIGAYAANAEELLDRLQVETSR
jgi:DNA-binding transcriptional ArsR family regulator